MTEGAQFVPMQTGERRRHLRWRLRKRLTGRISSDHKIAILDISLGGALIEHANPVRPGTVSFLTVSAAEQEITLRCRVSRSAIYRYEVRPTGVREHVYRTAVEFSAPSPDFRRLLHEITDSDQMEVQGQVYRKTS